MNILDRIDQRVALPGDSETRRSQKAISTLLLFSGGILTLFNMVAYLSLGMTTAAAIYAMWIATVLIGGSLILLFPRLWLPIGLAMIIIIMLVSFSAHLISGGFQAGLEAAVWMLLGPISAALFISPRFTIITLLFFMIAVISAAFLEPFAQAIAPELTLATRMQIASVNLIMIGAIATSAVLYLMRQVDHYRRRADDLLLNMLPNSIASRLKESPQTIADSYSAVTVLFADMVGSTPLFSNLEPAEAVDWLNEVFSMFDRLVEKYGLEKIRTIGDNYMVAAGVPTPRADHAQAMALLALDMVRGLQDIPARHGKRMAFRLGINSGPLVAGVIGQTKYHYDLWGDTVNVASRMESHGASGKIHITDATHEYLKNDFECASRGTIPIKGKGEMQTWYLLAPKKHSAKPPTEPQITPHHPK